MTSLEGELKRLKLLGGLAFAVATAGFTVAKFTEHTASAADLQDVRTQQQELHERVAIMEDHVKWLEEQLSRVADAVGAERVPPHRH